jgi:mitochondrial fission protein ELM1
MVEAALQACAADPVDCGTLALSEAPINGGRAPKTMRVLLLSDGVAGHDRSSLGILAAISKHRAVHASVLPVRERSRFSRRMKRLLAGVLPYELFWSLFYRVEGSASPANPLPLAGEIGASPVDLVISTGPRTAAANIAIARRLRARNVYFGTSRWPTDALFTLLLTSERLKPHPRRARVLRPSELDASQLPEARSLAGNGDVRRAAILFGGQSKHYVYTMADMELLAERLISVSRELPWLHWTFYDSRRSPEAEIDRLSELVGASGAAVEFVRFAEHGLLSNSEAFRSDLVLVTADSMSMLAESIAARRPTGILFADGYRPPRRDAVEHKAMIAERKAFATGFSDLTAQTLRAGTAELAVIGPSQLDTLYEALVAHGI